MLPVIPTTTAPYAIQPLLETMHNNNDRLPDSGTPVETMGTVQSNMHLIPEIRTYDSSGKLVGNPGSLIGRG